MSERESALQREIRQTRPFRSPAEEATVAILKTADVLRRRLAAVAESEGITLQQYNVLRILRGARGALPTLEIAERLLEQAPGITRLMDRLESKGLVERERSTEDRRRVYCRITDRGLELLARLDEPMDEADAAFAGNVPDDDLLVLIRTLDRIRAAAR